MGNYYINLKNLYIRCKKISFKVNFINSTKILSFLSNTVKLLILKATDSIRIMTERCLQQIVTVEKKDLNKDDRGYQDFN
jgi:hypothetical protein